jgi:hypothetical protein
MVAIYRRQGIWVSGIEGIRDRIRVVPFPGIETQEGDAVGVIKIPALFVLVIPRRQEDRSRVTDDTHPLALCQVALVGY